MTPLSWLHLSKREPSFATASAQSLVRSRSRFTLPLEQLRGHTTTRGGNLVNGDPQARYRAKDHFHDWDISAHLFLPFDLSRCHTDELFEVGNPSWVDNDRTKNSQFSPPSLGDFPKIFRVKPWPKEGRTYNLLSRRHIDLESASPSVVQFVSSSYSSRPLLEAIIVSKVAIAYVAVVVSVAILNPFLMERNLQGKFLFTTRSYTS